MYRSQLERRLVGSPIPVLEELRLIHVLVGVDVLDGRARVRIERGILFVGLEKEGEGKGGLGRIVSAVREGVVVSERTIRMTSSEVGSGVKR